MAPKATVLRAADTQTMTADWGGLVWYASGPLGNDGGMTIGCCTIKPGCANPLHSHPNCNEVLVVSAGRIAHLIEDGQEVEMGVGDVITVPPNLVHQARNIGTEDAVLQVAFSSPNRESAMV